MRAQIEADAGWPDRVHTETRLSEAPIFDAMSPEDCDSERVLAPAASTQRASSTSHRTYDEYTGAELDPAQVKAAKTEELDFFRKKGVWDVVSRDEAHGSRVVGTRWVSCNRGDENHPDVRCRLVCQEVKTYQSEELFASTPSSSRSGSS